MRHDGGCFLFLCFFQAFVMSSYLSGGKKLHPALPSRQITGNNTAPYFLKGLPVNSHTYLDISKIIQVEVFQKNIERSLEYEK